MFANLNSSIQLIGLNLPSVPDATQNTFALVSKLRNLAAASVLKKNQLPSLTVFNVCTYSLGNKMTSSTISGLLDKLVEDTQNEVTVEDVVSSFEERGFGPLLLIPSLMVILPTGAIPGVPSICGITLFLVCIQLAAGKDHPWLPKALRERSVSHDKLKKATDKARPYISKMEKLFTPRFTAMAKKPIRSVIAGISGIVALSMIPLEVIPFGAALPAFALALTAIGIAYRDGVVVTIGLIAQASTGILLYQVVAMA